MFNGVFQDVSTSKLLDGIAVFLAYTMLDPLMEDIQDTFGKSMLYHPLALHLCLLLLVYTQTQSFKTGAIVIALYEAAKWIWRQLTPEPPLVGKVRKLLHRVQNEEKLSDNDIAFLNDITPDDVSVKRQKASLVT